MLYSILVVVYIPFLYCKLLGMQLERMMILSRKLITLLDRPYPHLTANAADEDDDVVIWHDCLSLILV